MNDFKITSLLSLSILSSPLSIPAHTTPNSTIQASAETNSPRTASRRLKHELASSYHLQPMGTYVGELHEKWQFPSDHLPIAMTIDRLNLASWNVLDTEYIDWVIEKNSQGLARSMIADEHVFVGDSKLTIRDQHTADLVIKMISHPTHPRSILSLQECSKPFIEEIQSKIPEHFQIVSCFGEALLVDLRQFEIIEAKKVSGIFKDATFRTIQDVTLKRNDNGQFIRLLNVHLPGDPTKPGRYEFANYLADTFNPNITTIAMGDMNFNELEMSDAIKQAFPRSAPFSLYSPHCTNISPFEFNSKAIDHFLVYSPSKSEVTLNAPAEIMTELPPIIALLNGA